ncbi:hypothetical protein Hanom_Chr03g00277901 [Helianthus anomalus]
MSLPQLLSHIFFPPNYYNLDVNSRGPKLTPRQEFYGSYKYIITRLQLELKVETLIFHRKFAPIRILPQVNFPYHHRLLFRPEPVLICHPLDLSGLPSLSITLRMVVCDSLGCQVYPHMEVCLFSMVVAALLSIEEVEDFKEMFKKIYMDGYSFEDGVKMRIIRLKMESKELFFQPSMALTVSMVGFSYPRRKTIV